MVLSSKAWREINLMPSVRHRLLLVARGIAVRTQVNLTAAGVQGVEVTTSEGVRPKGRSYAQVRHNDRYGEYGTAHERRHRALGRAAASS